jgi:hypothetical protein
MPAMKAMALATTIITTALAREIIGIPSSDA